jgi:rRNA maturation endonuclease Nob1
MALHVGDRYVRLVIMGIERQDKHKNNIYKCQWKICCGNIFEHIQVEIIFCPICGRDLREEEN